MERKSYDDEILWDSDEDEARNRRRDPLRDSLGTGIRSDEEQETRRRGRPSNASRENEEGD